MIVRKGFRDSVDSYSAFLKMIVKPLQVWTAICAAARLTGWFWPGWPLIIAWLFLPWMRPRWAMRCRWYCLPAGP